MTTNAGKVDREAHFENAIRNVNLLERIIPICENGIETIRRAIDTIKTFEGEKAVITAKKLMDNTDLSRSVLYKSHVLKEWNPVSWEKRYGNGVKWKAEYDVKFEKDSAHLLNKIEKLIKENERLQRSNLKLEESVQNERKRSDVYKLDCEELKVKNQKLLAECQRLQNQSFARGNQ